MYVSNNSNMYKSKPKVTRHNVTWLFFAAFDMLKDPFTSLEILIQLGFDRILTSGQDSSALEGLPTISHLIEKVNDSFAPRTI